MIRLTNHKIKISDLCSNGLYYSESINLFVETFEMFKITNNYNELFVAPMYNQLIESNLKVKYVLLDKNEPIFSGTSDEYENILKKW